MSESFENIPVSEQQLIEALNTKGAEDPEAKELLKGYVDQCHAEADREAAADPKSSDVSNRANIKADIKIVSLYSKTEKYKDYARESLEETLVAASQDESTEDLAEEIIRLIENLES